MRALVLEKFGRSGSRPLKLAELDVPVPASGQILIKVQACGVCRTDLHVVEGELTHARLPLIPGHQVVGVVEEVGPGVDRALLGQRLGVPWLHASCGRCRFCQNGNENLCDEPQFTGYTVNGGFAEYLLARPEFALPTPPAFADLQAAPLLCAGLIGYRALRLTDIDGLGSSARLGLYGFGASAHIVIQVARHLGHEVYVFTRDGDEAGQAFARELGAVWAGGSGQLPPEKLDATIIFAPVGALVPRALQSLRKGGSCVCAGIHMSPLPGFHYRYLWGERVLRSVTNLTRRDGQEFLALAEEIPVQTRATSYALEDGNEALIDLKSGKLRGAAVLVP